MTMSTRSAHVTALPSVVRGMNPMPRRGFLAGLTKLSLVGGSVALIGHPRGVAEPATRQILEAYKTWLHYEHRCLAREMADLPDNVAFYGGTRSHRYDIIEPMTLNFGTGDASSYHRFDGTSPASSRAALVLSTVGCDWRDDEAPADWQIPERRA